MAIELTDVFTDNGLCEIPPASGAWVGKTVTIGTQTWMAENLSVTHYDDGTPIPYLDDADWITDTTGAYAVYDDDAENSLFYGKMYNWYAVDNSAGLAPDGWHIPTDAEWTTLTDYLDDLGGTSSGDESSKLGCRQDLWNAGDLISSPYLGISGFNALPAGYRLYNFGYYTNMGIAGYFWSSSEANSVSSYYRALFYTASNVSSGNANLKYGFYVRCIKD